MGLPLLPPYRHARLQYWIFRFVISRQQSEQNAVFTRFLLFFASAQICCQFHAPAVNFCNFVNVCLRAYVCTYNYLYTVQYRQCMYCYICMNKLNMLSIVHMSCIQVCNYSYVHFTHTYIYLKGQVIYIVGRHKCIHSVLYVCSYICTPIPTGTKLCQEVHQ